MHKYRRKLYISVIYAISAYRHQSCEFELRSWRAILDTTLCDKVCQWLSAGRWYSPGTPVSSTNKTERHNITEILLKVTLNTINQPYISICKWVYFLDINCFSILYFRTHTQGGTTQLQMCHHQIDTVIEVIDLVLI
jgi:hypothetical protein